MEIKLPKSSMMIILVLLLFSSLFIYSLDAYDLEFGEDNADEYEDMEGEHEGDIEENDGGGGGGWWDSLTDAFTGWVLDPIKKALNWIYDSFNTMFGYVNDASDAVARLSGVSEDVPILESMIFIIGVALFLIILKSVVVSV